MVSNNQKLTAKMEHFAQLLFQGYSQTDAYKLATLHKLGRGSLRFTPTSHVLLLIARLKQDSRSYAPRWVHQLFSMPYNVKNSGHRSSVMTARIHTGQAACLGASS